jgi:FtsP/CotA-like multicopper oxidase with cupredoxin domain
LAAALATTQRKLYFYENFAEPDNPRYFITVDGQPPLLFNPDNPPAIVTTQGAVEDWTIENRTLENHEFHIHQLHFLVLAQNGVPLPAANQQFLDTVQVPYWPGTGPYPSVTVRMDFRGPITGEFVYHCHILNHEDHGMMAIIKVNPAPAAAAP